MANDTKRTNDKTNVWSSLNILVVTKFFIFLLRVSKNVGTLIEEKRNRPGKTIFEMREESTVKNH